MGPERRKDTDPYKQAIKEIMDERLEAIYSAVGKWTIRGIFALLVSLIVHLILVLKPLDIRQIIMDVSKGS